MVEPILNVSIEEVGSVAIISLAGPIDSATHDQFKSAADPYFQRSAPRVILDCQGLTYINSKGLALLAKYHRSAMLDRGVMAVAAVNRKIVRTMDLLGLGKVLRFYETKEEALASMQ